MSRLTLSTQLKVDCSDETLHVCSTDLFPSVDPVLNGVYVASLTPYFELVAKSIANAFNRCIEDILQAYSHTADKQDMTAFDACVQKAGILLATKCPDIAHASSSTKP